MNPTPLTPIERAIQVYVDWKAQRPRSPFEEVTAEHPDISTLLQSMFDGDETLSTPAIPSDPAQVGPYRILQRLGQGGMGVVYVAEQQKPVRRRVALKVIKLGMDTKEVLARFEIEHHALAILNHPGIARVFSADMTEEGRPYFVMEYVPGKPLIKLCQQEQLDTQQRLDLFILICAAVQHAHQKGIIHRDLKPSNIIVTLEAGCPKPVIIDFGVAKATAQPLTDQSVYTELGRIIGTPAYMSPEQAEMSGLDIDTRTDVYSLGVILYELLTDTLPFDSKTLREASYTELQRIIREVEPTRPSKCLGASATSNASGTIRHTLSRRLRGDLDWITMKAMEKARARRYDSASELAADVQRHLDHEPVLAGPPSTVYRAKKFVRKNRILVTTSAVILVTVLLSIGLVVDSWAKEREARSDAESLEKEARLEADSAKTISNFLVGLFEEADPIAFGGRMFGARSASADLTARVILDRGVAKLHGILEDRPLVRARLLDTIGRVYLSLGLPAQAEPILTEGLRLRSKKLSSPSLELASSLENMADLKATRGEASSEDIRKVLKMRESLLGERNKRVIQTIANLGLHLVVEYDFDAAEPVLDRGLALCEQTIGMDSPEVALFLLFKAQMRILQEQPMKVAPLAKRAAKIIDSINNTDHFTHMVNSFVSAQVKEMLGLSKAARTEYENVITLGDKALGRNHFVMAWAHDEYARFIHRKVQDLPLALKLRLETLRRYVANYGDESPLLIWRLIEVGRAQRDTQNYRSAIKTLTRALTLCRATQRVKFDAASTCLHILGVLYFYEADYEASNKSHSEALTIQLKHAGAEAEYTQSIMEVIAFSLLHQSGVDLAHNIVRHPRTDIAKHRSAVAYAKALPLIESRARKLDDLSASQAQAVDHYCSKQAVNLLRELLTSGYMNADTLMNSPEFVSLHAIPDYQLLFN